MACREHLTQLRQHKERLSELNIAVAVVTFDADAMAQAYVEETKLPWALLMDAELSLYRAYSMDKATLWSLYSPTSIWNYLKLISHGQRVRQPGHDMHQLGGDVLIDPTGTVRLHFVSTSPHDRPSPESIFAIAEQG